MTAKELAGKMVESVTNEWVDLFESKHAAGCNMLTPFWRLALHVLPEGVDGDDPRVVAALAKIRAAVAAAELRS